MLLRIITIMLHDVYTLAKQKISKFRLRRWKLPVAKDLCLALEEAIRKNPEVFTSDLVAQVGKARVV